MRGRDRRCRRGYSRFGRRSKVRGGRSFLQSRGGRHCFMTLVLNGGVDFGSGHHGGPALGLERWKLMGVIVTRSESLSYVN